MNTVKQFLFVHWFWFVFALGGFIAFHSWLQEHDARLASNAAEQVAKVQVTADQKQMADNDKVKAQLQQEMADRDAATQAQIAAMTKLVASVKTTPQAVQAIDTLSNHQVQPVAQANGDMLILQPQVIPLFTELADGKQATISLTTCTQDLTATKTLVVKSEANLDLQKDITKQRDNEIAILKKPQGFWKRVGTTLKVMGAGIGIGLTLGKVI
jgi:hypothetical protein